MSFKFSIRPSYPICEIATSHFFWLKRLKMRVIKNRVSLIKIVIAQCRFVFWVSIGLAAAVRKEIMKFINMLYIEQKHIQKKIQTK